MHLNKSTTFATVLRLIPFIIFCFVLLTLTSYGQENRNYTLKGAVKDEHNGEPLAFAFIVIEGTNQATTSDSLGNYKLENICPGKTIIHCDHMGCERIIDTLYIKNDLTHNFHPEHHVNELGDLIINVEQSETETKFE